MRMDDLVIDERDQIFVIDRLLAIGEILEAGEGILKRIVAEFVAQFAAASL